MKKTSFVVAILVSALLAACGGKKTPATTSTGSADMAGSGSAMGSGEAGSAGAGSAAGSGAM